MTLLADLQYIRLTHPTTGKFCGEFDWQRGVLMVVDRGGTAFFDLVRLAEEKRMRWEALHNATE
jgi:hypothetical protein